MLEIRQLSNLHVAHYKEEIITFWNRNLGHSFPIYPELFERNIMNSSFVDQEHSFLAFSNQHVIGMIIVKRELPSPPSVSRLDSSQKYWINSILVDSDYRTQGIGAQLLASLEARLVKDDTILIGTDRHHLFPGIPSTDTEIVTFFRKKGYDVTGTAYDLRANIGLRNAEYPLPERYSVRRLMDGEENKLLELIQHNFSDRWYTDTNQSLLNEKPISSIIGLFELDHIIGFAHIYTFRDEYIGPSIYWKDLLDPHYGGLGPIGVAKSHQNRGLGTSFFEAILEQLSQEGVKDMVVDWTILLDFYGKFGFMPWKEYTHGQKKIIK